jgi:hypothetical protein
MASILGAELGNFLSLYFVTSLLNSDQNFSFLAKLGCVLGQVKPLLRRVKLHREAMRNSLTSRYSNIVIIFSG